MAIHYKNPKTGEYEVIKIPVMRGEQGHAGIHVGSDAPPTTDVKLWFDPSDTDNDVDLANRLDTTLTACYDYMGNDQGSIKKAADANVEYVLGEVNTAHYEGQRITATDTIEGRTRSAILKGQTLVNIFDNWEKNCGSLTPTKTRDGYFLFNGNNKYAIVNLDDIPMFKREATYTFIYRVKNSTYSGEDGNTLRLDVGGATMYAHNITNGIWKVKKAFLADEDLCYVKVLSWIGSTGSAEVSLQIVRGDHTGVDIPYFEGMQSVQMPAVTMTGKNLVPDDLYPTLEEIPYNKGGIKTALKLQMLPNTSYKFSMVKTREVINEFDGYNYITNSSKEEGEMTYRASSPVGTKKVIRVTTNSDGVILIGNYNFKFWEWGNCVVSLDDDTNDFVNYEPHKTNILTINDNVELRGIGDTQDTLDLISGKVTQRVLEYLITGDEEWIKHSSTNTFSTVGGIVKYSNKKRNIISDKLLGRYVPSNTWLTHMEVCVFDSKIGIGFDGTLEELVEYLKLNRPRIFYVNEEETIKTVDLNSQNVYSYDETTHYTCSAAEGSLIPVLSIDVPTNLPLLVAKQRQQIETLEEENQELSNKLKLAITSSEQNDSELLAQSFELDFRIMEVESALNLPMAATFQLGGKAMAMTPYDMAKKLILAGNYERTDMEHKLNIYVSKKRMTEAERQGLIQLMNEAEGVVTIEPENDELVTEHEAVTIPLH